MSGVLDFLPPEVRNKLRRERQPEWTQPMLATLSARHFSDPQWIFEPKLDGERCLAFRRGRTVRLMTRNLKRIDSHYAELVEALAAQDADDFIVDGEIVAFDGDRTSFARLQRRMQVPDPERARATGVAVFYYLFDVLHAAGYDTTAVPLLHRKEILRRLLSFEDPLRFTKGDRRHWRNESRTSYDASEPRPESRTASSRAHSEPGLSGLVAKSNRGRTKLLVGAPATGNALPGSAAQTSLRMAALSRMSS